MLFLTMFKTLEGKVIVVELKNDLQIRGTLSSVDQYLNIKLSDITVMTVKSLFIRGSVVRYVHLPPDGVDTGLLQDAARREAMESSKPAGATAAGASGGGAGAGAGAAAGGKR